MRSTAPNDFSIQEFFRGTFTFQGWEIFPGHKTKGKDVVQTLHWLGAEADFSGKRVLDIAPWNGFFGFECMRRGAASLVSLGPDDPEVTGYYRVRELLEIPNCRYVRASVYDLDPKEHGQFDVIFFLGVFYHLRHPLLALDKIYDVALSDVYIDSPIIDHIVYDQTVPADVKEKMKPHKELFHTMPLFHFSKWKETRDAFNWFMPNKRALRDSVESSGFDIQHFHNDPGWAYLKTVKGTRSFVPGIEGYNPARFPPNNK